MTLRQHKRRTVARRVPTPKGHGIVVPSRWRPGRYRLNPRLIKSEAEFLKVFGQPGTTSIFPFGD